MRLELGTALLAVLLLAGCASGPKHGKEWFSEKEYGVKASPRVIRPGEPVPRGGGRQMVGVPYVVHGKWYYPGKTPYSQTGLASWYGSEFHGRLTANGEVYDVAGLSAAHPTLPLPSYARVTNVTSGRSVIVRVNDRGPYFSDRIIDLSSRAADMLGLKDDGVGKVKVDYVGPARMDGLDENMLLASYRGPGSMAAARNMVASASPPPAPKPSVGYINTGPAPRLAGPVSSRQPNRPAPPQEDAIAALLASNAALPVQRAGSPGRPAAGQRSAPSGGPLQLTPRMAVSGYAATSAPTPAETAISDLALRESGAAVAPADASTAAKARVVQAGTYAVAANADRVASKLRAYGTVSVADATIGGKLVHTVRVSITDPAISAEEVRAAAR